MRNFILLTIIAIASCCKHSFGDDRLVVWQGPFGHACVTIPCYREAGGGLPIDPNDPNSPIESNDQILDRVIREDIPNGPTTFVMTRSDLPVDRYFRNAWNVDGLGRFGIDRSKAEAIHRERLTSEAGALTKRWRDKYQDHDIEGSAQGKQRARAKLAELKSVATMDLSTAAAPTLDDLKRLRPAVLDEVVE